MKLVLLAPLLLSLSTFAQEDYKSISPLWADLELGEDDRLIEPTSPILGKRLVERIRKDQRHPGKILEDLLSHYPDLKRDLQASSIVYFDTLSGPLKKYCEIDLKVHEKASDKETKVVETGAIPLEVLKPLHQSYRENLSTFRSSIGEKDLDREAKLRAEEYQEQRHNCNTVKQIDGMEDKIRKMLPTAKLKRLLELHQEISSAEAAFPRIQFSVNGFTQFVYNQLMDIPYDRLSDLLKINYEAQIEWIEAKERDEDAGRYMSAFEKKARGAGFAGREILLVMAYSLRNMPSLDVQYGKDANKALMLETYFWKSQAHRNIVQKKWEKDLYPNKVMKRNPGMYHYATSALMACEIKLRGHSGAMARITSLGNKLAYKIHKLMAEIKGNDGKSPKLRVVMAIAKRQAFGPGIAAGRFGGSYGLKLCRQDIKANKRQKALPLEDELDADDLPADVEEMLE